MAENQFRKNHSAHCRCTACGRYRQGAYPNREQSAGPFASAERFDFHQYSARGGVDVGCGHCAAAGVISELAESIKQGDTGHLTTWLADIISEGAVPEEIKRATELLEKLTEYKPLAKIEEAEEQNYNMIDNVLNNGVGEKAQREENKRMEEKPTVRISLKSRLAEKKSQVEGQSKEHDVQENEKKSQREM